MRYASIFFTILFIWLAAIAMAFTRNNPKEVFEIYVVTMLSTIALFLIGFGKK